MTTRFLRNHRWQNTQCGHRNGGLPTRINYDHISLPSGYVPWTESKDLPPIMADGQSSISSRKQSFPFHISLNLTGVFAHFDSLVSMFSTRIFPATGFILKIFKGLHSGSLVSRPTDRPHRFRKSQRLGECFITHSVDDGQSCQDVGAPIA